MSSFVSSRALAVLLLAGSTLGAAEPAAFRWHLDVGPTYLTRTRLTYGANASVDPSTAAKTDRTYDDGFNKVDASGNLGDGTATGLASRTGNFGFISDSQVDLKAGTLTRQTTRSQRRQTSLVGQARQRVGLVHELAQLGRREELLDGRDDRTDVHQRHRRDRLGILRGHALTHDTLDLVRALCDVTLKMIEGELYQLTKNGVVDLTEDEHYDIVRRKTAYLFAGSARLGGMLGPGTNAEQEEAVDELDIDYGGDSIEIGFNVTYIIDVLGNMDQDMVRIDLADANSSALITMPDNENFKYVVMPMRI